VVILFWMYAPITIGGQELTDIIYEMVPGFIASVLAILIVDAVTRAPKGKVKEHFETMEAHIEEHG
jgi:SSS family solute:Na+ symporter